MGALSQRIQQVRVDVVADAEGKETLSLEHRAGNLDDALHRCLAYRRLAVGQENNLRQPAAARFRSERLTQRRLDIGAAVGVHRCQPFARLAHAAATGRGPTAAEPPHHTAEGDDAKPIVLVETGEHLVHRGARLLDLVARHRAGDVENERHVARDGDLRRLCRRRQQHHVVARLTARRVGHDAGADHVLAQRQEQVEITRRITGTGVGDLHLVSAAFADLNAMARRIRRREALGIGYVDGHGERYGTRPLRRRRQVCHGLEQLLVPRAPGNLVAGVEKARDARVAEPQQVAVAAQNLRVAQDDAARLPRIDGKHAGPQHTVPDELDERRVLLATHNLLVDAARGASRQHLTLELLLAHEQRKVGEYRASGDRIEIIALHHAVPVVAKLLFDLEARHTLIAVDGDPHVGAYAPDARVRRRHRRYLDGAERHGSSDGALGARRAADQNDGQQAEYDSHRDVPEKPLHDSPPGLQGMRSLPLRRTTPEDLHRKIDPRSRKRCNDPPHASDVTKRLKQTLSRRAPRSARRTGVESRGCAQPPPPPRA